VAAVEKEGMNRLVA